MQDVLREFGALIGEVEKLFQGVVAEGGECATDSADRLRSGVERLRERMSDIERKLQHQVTRAAGDADRYVHDHPWRIVGVAAGAAFLMGLLIARRD